jgi:hypothetical protein
VDVNACKSLGEVVALGLDALDLLDPFIGDPVLFMLNLDPVLFMLNLDPVLFMSTLDPVLLILTFPKVKTRFRKNAWR